MAPKVEEMQYEYKALMEWWQQKPKYLAGKSVPMSLCPMLIQHKLAWNWTQASAITSHHLTAWSMM